MVVDEVLEDVLGQVFDMEAVLVVAVVLKAPLRCHIKTIAPWAASERGSERTLMLGLATAFSHCLTQGPCGDSPVSVVIHAQAHDEDSVHA